MGTSRASLGTSKKTMEVGVVERVVGGEIKEVGRVKSG